MTTLYRVAGWDDWFESAKSRTYKTKSQSYTPNKHGLGFKRIVATGKGEHGAALFGAWSAMVQILSRQTSPRQGYLTDTGRHDGVPLTPSDMALLTGMPISLFSELFALASSQAVGWLLVESSRIPQGYCGDTAVAYHGKGEGECKGSGEGSAEGGGDADAGKESKRGPLESFGEFKSVRLSQREYTDLCVRHGEDRLKAAIEVLDGYITSKGKRYANHAAVFKTGSWVWDRVITNKPNDQRGLTPSTGRKLINTWVDPNPDPSDLAKREAF